MGRVIAILACSLSVAACSASLPSLPSLSFLKSTPQTQVLRIESDPPGAEAKTSQGPSCRTPCELAVEVNDGLSVTVSRDGYQPQTVQVTVDTAPGAAASDALVAPASAPRLDPNPVYFELVAVPATPGKKPPAKKPKPKSPTTAARPAAPAETTMAAIPIPSSGLLPASSPSTETAASASNYPWSLH